VTYPYRRRAGALALVLAGALCATTAPPVALPLSAAASAPLTLPRKDGSVKFAVIGDSGTGDQPQYQTAQVLNDWRADFPFDLVLMLGDNIYGRSRPADYRRKFEEPYRALLDAGVKFYAALGNHDDPAERSYEKFNMKGQNYYTFKAPQGGVRFFALDSNYMDKKQLDWLEKELQAAGSDWKVCFCHHPLYSSGMKHGPDEELRGILEPLLVKYHVDVVLAGHEHFYERILPQHDIHYFISGAAGQLRRGNIEQSPLDARGFDQDLHFMLFEIAGDELYFQTVSRAGKTVDSGSFKRAPGGKNS
jgi:predicted phosphodiesterase